MFRAVARGNLRRRTFIKYGAASGAVAGAVLARPGLALGQAPALFGHGVASGDPMPDRVIIWTRVTPVPEATAGSGLGPPTEVDWEVARDQSFTQIVAHGQAVSAAASDHTIKLDVTGLPADTELWYRFHASGQTSEAGRTRTAPEPGASVDSLRVGVVSCSNYPAGYFSAYRHLADRDDLDLVLHLGDYLYESGRSNEDLGRVVDPAVEITVLEHYRRRHGLYKTDPDLQRLHARCPWVTTIDDHEVTNDSWADGAQNHQSDEGDYRERRAASFQAYFEWMPIRPTGGAAEPHRIYRRLGWGDLVDIVMLDERTYRSRQIEGLSGSLFVTDPAVADADRTMLGAEQRAWLQDQLDQSSTAWRVVGNSVMFAPLVFADLPDIDAVTPALRDALAEAGLASPIVLNGDQWDGYQAEQAEVSRMFAAAGGVVLLTGDIHSSWGAEIPDDPGAYLRVVGGDTNAVEFVTPAVTSSSLVSTIEGLGLPAPEVIAQGVPVLVDALAPWFKYFDGERQGFGVFEITAERAQYDWYHLSDREDPEATASVAASWASPAGSNKLVAAAPLGPRPGRVSAAPEVVEAAEVSSAPGPEPSSPVRATLPSTGGDASLAAGVGAATAAVAALAAARRAPRDTPDRSSPTP